MITYTEIRFMTLVALGMAITVSGVRGEPEQQLAPPAGQYLFSVSGDRLDPDPQVATITESSNGELIMTIELQGKQVSSTLLFAEGDKDFRNYAACFSTMIGGSAVTLVLHGQITARSRDGKIIHGTAVEIVQSRSHMPGMSAAAEGRFALKPTEANKSE